MQRDKEFKILFVDDEQYILNAFDRLLIDTPYDIELCNSSVEALKRIEDQVFSVIVSDNIMPEIQGVTLLEKASYLRPEAVRILLTGYSDLSSAIDAINKGHIYKYVSKPWNDTDLLELLDNAVEQYKMNVLQSHLLESMRLIEVGKPSHSKEEVKLILSLSLREREVLEHLAKGQSNEDISKEMHLSSQTVKNHLSNIYKKLNVNSRTAAALLFKNRTS